jgi:hypothetical protein
VTSVRLAASSRCDDTRAQGLRRSLAWRLRPDRLAQSLEPRIFLRQGRIAGEKPIHFNHPGRIEFAVERRVQHEGAILAIRGADHAILPSLSIINVRARASRDMTVPIGAPVVSAISR